MNSLFRRFNELTRNRAARNLILEDEALSGCRFNFELDVRILAAAACLFLENLLARRGLRDRLAISNLRFAYVGFDAKLALHAIDDDFQVQLAHAGDNCLARFMISRNIERWIFLRQP